jgi:ribonuclease R
MKLPFKDSDITILQRIAETSTAREIDAAHAERDSKKLKQVEYMSERVGQTFKGTISGVAKWGVYVQESETMCEGIIPIAKLGEDYFVFNEKTYSIEGEKTGQKFTLGDAITFKVVFADLDKKQLEMALVK